jgi:lysophospholipase L1-like esterase
MALTRKLALVAVLVLAACGVGERPSLGPTTTETIKLPKGAASVYVIGDSLTVGTEPYLRRELAARGWRLAGVDARISRTVEEGLRVLRAKERRLPETVMLALGSNDLFASQAQVEAWVETARETAGTRRLIWVNVYVDVKRAPLLKGYRVINRGLSAAAVQHNVEIADWNRWMTRHRAPMQRDGVHYTPVGYRKRAAFYARVVAAPSA